MTWFFAVLIVLVIGAVAVVAAGRGASLGPSYDDRHDVRLPVDRPVTGHDLRRLRFNTVLRGYRASEVDALIDRLAAQLDERKSDEMDGPGGSDPDGPQ
ncbi:MAG: DivIVA domain-containing protein [Marmoricola sp.]